MQSYFINLKIPGHQLDSSKSWTPTSNTIGKQKGREEKKTMIVPCIPRIKLQRIFSFIQMNEILQRISMIGNVIHLLYNVFSVYTRVWISFCTINKTVHNWSCTGWNMSWYQHIQGFTTSVYRSFLFGARTSNTPT